MTTAFTTEPAYWSAAQKIAFRFFFIFFLLYIFLNPNDTIPFYGVISNFYIPLFHQFIPWMAKSILHLSKPVTEFTNGSGDTTYDYLIVLFITVVSAIGAIIWSITGKGTRNYNKLLYWLIVVVRFFVAITMVTYGSLKIIKLQFPAASFGRLLEPVGNMSPMGLAWTYMGYSTGFNYFTGFAELTCALLLFFRKTTTLGAIVGLVVAANIAAINYSFDVPVKLLSTFLVLMCLFILIRDTRRLINFFFKNKEAQPSNLTPHRFKARWKNITLNTIKYLMIFFVLSTNFYQAIQGSKLYGENAKRPPLYGLYNVETFIKNRDTLKPLTTDTIRWSKFWISYVNGASVKLMNDSVKHYNFMSDTVKHIITANTYADTLHKFFLTYSIQKPDILILQGHWEKDSVYIRLRKMDPNKFLLLKRGFRMINEYPFNR